MTDAAETHPTIRAPRVELVLLTREYLAAHLARAPLPDLGFVDPGRFLADADDVAELRLSQLDEDPAIAPWLLRAIVLSDERVAVGYINCHAAPDERGMIEIGYELLPAFRRRGYANEAAEALIGWAATRGVHTVRASVSPENAPSLAMIAKLGFVQVGEQIDEIDGLELVFERPCIAPPDEP